MAKGISRRDVLRAVSAMGASAVLPRSLRATGPVTAANVTVTTTAVAAIGPAFAGLSYEKGQMANPFFPAQNSNAIGLLRLIGPSLLRIGGNSVDKTTWTLDGTGRT